MLKVLVCQVHEHKMMGSNPARQMREMSAMVKMKPVNVNLLVGTLVLTRSISSIFLAKEQRLSQTATQIVFAIIF